MVVEGYAETEGVTRVDEPKTIRVVAADDFYLIREALELALEAAAEIDLVAVCSDGKELTKAIAASHPEVVVTDIRMPPSGEEGIEIANALRDTNPDIGVVVLSQYSEPAYALSLLDRGSARRAYLLKERIRQKQELIGAIETVAVVGR